MADDPDAAHGEFLRVVDVLATRAPCFTNREQYTFSERKINTLAAPKLAGNFPLNQTTINQNVRSKIPGVYVLGATNQNNTLPVLRSGRSDDDLAGRLATHIGKYSYFAYALCLTAAGAFYAECELHHDYNPPDNILHPDRPNGTNLKCPRCKVFG